MGVPAASGQLSNLTLSASLHRPIGHTRIWSRYNPAMSAVDICVFFARSQPSLYGISAGESSHARLSRVTTNERCKSAWLLSMDEDARPSSQDEQTSQKQTGLWSPVGSSGKGLQYFDDTCESKTFLLMRLAIFLMTVKSQLFLVRAS